MTFDNAIKALSLDALKYVRNGYVIGLGSGRAATILVKSLSAFVRSKSFDIKCVPTSMQIKLIAEKGNLQLIDADQIDIIDVVFDGADQIDKNKFLIKGGGGALLKENILISKSKNISKIGGQANIRILERGYPFFTENGNIILDADFGIIKNPKILREKILNMAGVLEVGIFTRKPDVIYKARANGKFDVLV